MTSPARGATRHIDLRPLGPADGGHLVAWLEPGEAAAWLASAKGDPLRQGWIVELGGAPAGLAGVVDVDRGHQRCAWAHHLDAPDVGVEAYVHYWGCEYVFEGLRFAKLWCEAPAGDAALLARLESCGLGPEARLRGHVEHGGERADVVRLAILAGDWRAMRRAMAARLRTLGFEPPAIG
ncbi:MAG TPA: UDP-4-amino-4,6-dideoxy-N-acetyl-beta-L-altrosamine N-acetyltransferase [Caulobacteraceae bacterium]|nr:UDP-4-amino-4,6-dideoxy-N-acetyl-beta-L-altrosamine N-acetyltransferase [Caulobacteraceae bacterium]